MKSIYCISEVRIRFEKVQLLAGIEEAIKGVSPQCSEHSYEIITLSTGKSSP